MDGAGRQRAAKGFLAERGVVGDRCLETATTSSKIQSLLVAHRILSCKHLEFFCWILHCDFRLVMFNFIVLSFFYSALVAAPAGEDVQPRIFPMFSAVLSDVLP